MVEGILETAGKVVMEGLTYEFEYSYKCFSSRISVCKLSCLTANPVGSAFDVLSGKPNCDPDHVMTTWWLPRPMYVKSCEVMDSEQ